MKERQCKICDEKIDFGHDYGTTCHNTHKYEHCSCWAKRRNDVAKKEFDG